ncbi:MAG: hypothetical protein JXQ80_02020, partial [Bacteroidales bacterium]|nr:hypothetical protein [Bacteroidales bacterium]
DLFVIHEPNKYNITKTINQLSSDLRFLFNEKEVDYNRSLLSFQDFYNELNNGYGDFYHSLFDLWAFEFKIGTEIVLKGNITLQIKLVFSDGKTLKHSKKYFLKN